MPTTQTATPGTKKLLEQSAMNIADNAMNSRKTRESLRKKLRQFFSF